MSFCRYNKLSRQIRDLVEKIAKLDKQEAFKSDATYMLLEKLYGMGLIHDKSDLEAASKVSASCFCRRRLPVVMVKSEFLHFLFYFFFSFYVHFFYGVHVFSLLYFVQKDKLSENIKNATDLVESGHVRVGTEMVKDCAFLVSRNLEDFVTWVDGSKIKQHVMSYNDLRDDFEI